MTLESVLEYINSLKNIQIITNKKKLSENEVILEYINTLKTFNYKDYDCLLFLLDYDNKEIITQILNIYSLYLNFISLSLIKDDDKRIINKILKIDRYYLDQFQEPLLKDYILKYIIELQDNLRDERYYNFQYMLRKYFDDDYDIIIKLKEYVIKYINKLQDNIIIDYYDNFLDILLFLLDNNDKEIITQILQIYGSYLNRISFSLINKDKKIITKILEIDNYYFDRFSDSILKIYVFKYINDLEFKYDYYYNFKNSLLDKFKYDKDIIFALKDFVLKYINELCVDYYYGDYALCVIDNGNYEEDDDDKIVDNKFVDSLLSRFKDDKDIVFAAVNFNFRVLKLFSLELINNKDIILRIINNFNYQYQNGYETSYLNYQYRHLNGYETHINIMNYLFENLSYNMKDDKEIMLRAISCYKLFYNFASERLKTDKDIILCYLDLEEDVDLDMRYAIYKFLDNLEDNMKDIIKDDKDIILSVIKIKKKYIQLASTKLINDKDIIYYMLNINNYNSDLNINGSNGINEDLCIHDDNKYIEYFIKNLNNEFKDDNNIIIKLIKSNGLYIKYASDRLKKDKNIVLEAIKYVYYEYIPTSNTHIKFLYTPGITSHNIKFTLPCIQTISNNIDIILSETKIKIDNDILNLIKQKLKHVDNNNECDYFENLIYNT